MTSSLQPYSGIDPTRIKERALGGPYFMRGFITHDGERVISSDRNRMWVTAIIDTCWDEGLNYDGHRIG